MNIQELLISLLEYDQHFCELVNHYKQKTSNWKYLDRIPEDERTYAISYICFRNNCKNLMHVPLKFFGNSESYEFYYRYEDHCNNSCYKKGKCEMTVDDKKQLNLEKIKLATVLWGTSPTTKENHIQKKLSKK